MNEEVRRRKSRKLDEYVRLNSQIPKRYDDMLREYCAKHEVTITVALKRAIENLVVGDNKGQDE